MYYVLFYNPLVKIGENWTKKNVHFWSKYVGEMKFFDVSLKDFGL